jgi:hypothetical protein
MSVPLTAKWQTFFEIGALCGHPEPADFANAMIQPPCDHLISWFFDHDETCSAPCGQKHWWCSACLCPMYPQCPIVD